MNSFVVMALRRMAGKLARIADKLMLLAHHMLRGSGVDETIYVTIAADLSNGVLKTLAGNPVVPVNVVCTINSGVTCSLQFRTSNIGDPFPVGSTLKIINHSKFRGLGGGGGAGGDEGNFGGYAGGPGGPAIRLNDDITMDTTDGTIWGGGGGGAGGPTYSFPGLYGGGGGGAGAGVPGVVGGLGGAGATPGGDGGATIGDSTPGEGGLCGYPSAEPGAIGGGPGAKGGDTSTAVGGAAGKAIELNGHTVTWLGGNNSAQVKGPVA
jgi:hypothetical protein